MAGVSRISGGMAQSGPMKRLPLLLAAAAATLALAPASFAHDDKDRADQRAASAALARHEILPITRILGVATAKVPGDVIKVKLERERWGFQYEVKVLARDGQVREIKLDARNGRILSIEDD